MLLASHWRQFGPVCDKHLFLKKLIRIRALAQNDTTLMEILDTMDRPIMQCVINTWFWKKVNQDTCSCAKWHNTVSYLSTSITCRKLTRSFTMKTLKGEIFFSNKRSRSHLSPSCVWERKKKEKKNVPPSPLLCSWLLWEPPSGWVPDKDSPPTPLLVGYFSVSGLIVSKLVSK